MKAKRNKTIDTPLSEGQELLGRCISVEDKQCDLGRVMDTTINGDMMQVCPLLPGRSFDLIIADPPYNLSKTYSETRFAKKKESDYADYTRQWLSIVKPLLKATGSIYVCCDWETSLIIGGLLGDFFHVRSRITWQREKGRGAKANWKNCMEDIWFATNDDEYTFNLDDVKVRRKVVAPYREKGNPKDWTSCEFGNYRDTCPSNFWDDITVPFWSMPENTAHPTQKPEKLVAKMVLASSNAGDVVLDPFLGSGTTSVVAKKLGRHYVGIEKEKQFCVWAEQRLEMAGINTSIQGYTDGVFWERNTLPVQNVNATPTQWLSTRKNTVDKMNIPSQRTLFDVQ